MTNHPLVADGLRSPDSLSAINLRLAGVGRRATEFDAFVRGRTPALLRAPNPAEPVMTTPTWPAPGSRCAGHCSG